MMRNLTLRPASCAKTVRRPVRFMQKTLVLSCIDLAVLSQDEASHVNCSPQRQPWGFVMWRLQQERPGVAARIFKSIFQNAKAPAGCRDCHERNCAFVATLLRAWAFLASDGILMNFVWKGSSLKSRPRRQIQCIGMHRLRSMCGDCGSEARETSEAIQTCSACLLRNYEASCKMCCYAELLQIFWHACTWSRSQSLGWIQEASVRLSSTSAFHILSVFCLVDQC